MSLTINLKCLNFLKVQKIFFVLPITHNDIPTQLLTELIKLNQPNAVPLIFTNFRRIKNLVKGKYQMDYCFTQHWMFHIQYYSSVMQEWIIRENIVDLTINNEMLTVQTWSRDCFVLKFLLYMCLKHELKGMLSSMRTWIALTCIKKPTMKDTRNGNNPACAIVTGRPMVKEPQTVLHFPVLLKASVCTAVDDNHLLLTLLEGTVLLIQGVLIWKSRKM